MRPGNALACHVPRLCRHATLPAEGVVELRVREKSIRFARATLVLCLLALLKVLRRRGCAPCHSRSLPKRNHLLPHSITLQALLHALLQLNVLALWCNCLVLRCVLVPGCTRLQVASWHQPTGSRVGLGRPPTGVDMQTGC